MFSLMECGRRSGEALAVCTNGLLKAATRFGLCPGMVDSRVGSTERTEGVNAELITLCMFSVSHQAGGARGSAI